MANEKMREEFATWYLKEVTQSYGEGVRAQAEKNLAWLRPDGSFADPMLRLACLAWSASRESIVIELPDRNTKVDEYDGLQTWDDCKAAIEVAGLKVKS